MGCREMKWVEGKRIYKKNSCEDLIQNFSYALNDQE